MRTVTLIFCPTGFDYAKIFLKKNEKSIDKMSDTNYDLTIIGKKKGQKAEVLANRHLLSYKRNTDWQSVFGLVLKSYIGKLTFMSRMVIIAPVF